MSFAFRVLLPALALSLGFNGPVGAPFQPASSASAVQNSADEPSLRALAEAFFQTWAAKDLDAFLRLWSAQAPELEARKKATAELFAQGVVIRTCRRNGLRVSR